MSAIQSFTVAESMATVISALDGARDHIDIDVNAEMPGLRTMLAELEQMLQRMGAL